MTISDKALLDKIKSHNKHVNDQFRKAEKGQIIDLTEMMISKEKIHQEEEKNQRCMICGDWVRDMKLHMLARHSH